MELWLQLIESYGATTVLSAVAIYLFCSLNRERSMLLSQLDKRTTDFLTSLNKITGRIDTVQDDVKDIKDILKDVTNKK